MMSIAVLQHVPSFEHSAILTIHALAPLSMVAKMPGKYYRSQAEPTEDMLLGMLENALGWHIAETPRRETIKELQKKHGLSVRQTGVGFASLLQFHVRL